MVIQKKDMAIKNIQKENQDLEEEIAMLNQQMDGESNVNDGRVGELQGRLDLFTAHDREQDKMIEASRQELVAQR